MLSVEWRSYPPLARQNIPAIDKKMMLRLFILMIFVVDTAIVSTVLANTDKNRCAHIERAKKKLDYNVCRAIGKKSYSSELNQKVTGSEKKQSHNNEKMLEDLQSLTGLSRSALASCIPELVDEGCSATEELCPNDEYSSIDGTCNNLENPKWGSANVGLRRDLAADYGDGLRSVRRSKRGKELPNARKISNAVLSESHDTEDSEFAVWTMAFGTLVTNDLVKTPVSTDADGNPIDCCNKASNGLCHSLCLPIDTTEDPYFSSVGQTCINVVRSVSAMCCSKQCTRNQINTMSSYIAGGPTYGDDLTALLALKDGAKLKMGPSGKHSKDLPPHKNQKDCHDSLNNDDQYCYAAGDSRVNFAPTHQSTLTLFAREHNRIVDKLVELNNGWNNETLFQEARKIVIAEYQHFTLKDFAEVILDDNTLSIYDLEETYGHDAVYDPSIDAGISASFSTAAFRYGHSTINSLQGQHQATNNKELSSFPLHEEYFRVEKSCKLNGHNGILRFQQSRGMGEMDAMRCRDNGLPSYNKWKQWCGQSDFPADHTQQTADKIRSVYDSEDDINVFVGGVSETKVDGGLVGPLFACMIGRQFHRLKYGDRFYFQNPRDVTTTKGRFNEDQIKSLQALKLARIVCENTDTQKIQPDVFRRVGNGNQEVLCSDYSRLPDIDFSLWKI